MTNWTPSSMMERLSDPGSAVLLSAETINTFRSAHWRHFKQVPNFILAPVWRPWVLATGSLTQRLIRASKGNFRVQVLDQHWALPWPSEQAALDLPLGQQVLVREVALVCEGEPWVQARTVIPPATLTGPRRRLKHLGETPLGAYLFKCRDMRRGPLEIAAFYLPHGLHHHDALADSSPTGESRTPSAWGRRSLFLLSEHPLLVSEFFLPEILSARAPSIDR